jgi:hypothetical protein
VVGEHVNLDNQRHVRAMILESARANRRWRVKQRPCARAWCVIECALDALVGSRAGKGSLTGRDVEHRCSKAEKRRGGCGALAGAQEREWVREAAIVCVCTLDRAATKEGGRRCAPRTNLRL